MTKDADILPKEDGELEKQEQDTELVSDEMILGLYGEILGDIRDDRKMYDELMTNFAEMVFNEGDGSNASKEALVNLAKAKGDAADKMSKIADLVTRIKLKERNTMQDWQKSKHNNTVNIIDNSGATRRELIESINKAKGKKK